MIIPIDSMVMNNELELKVPPPLTMKKQVYLNDLHNILARTHTQTHTHTHTPQHTTMHTHPNTPPRTHTPHTYTICTPI